MGTSTISLSLPPPYTWVQLLGAIADWHILVQNKIHIGPPYVKARQFKGGKIEVTVEYHDALVAHNKLFCDKVQDRVCELSCFGPSWSPWQAIDGDDLDHMVAHKVLGG